MSKIKLFCLLGLPGVGKGTLAEHFHMCDAFSRISTGDIFREEAKKDTEQGRNIKNLLDQGLFMPDRLVCDVVKSNLDNIKKFAKEKNNSQEIRIVFDGFPRSPMQADFIINWAEDNSDIVDFGGFVLITNITDNKLKERLAHRLTCDTCGTTYFDKGPGYKERLSQFDNSPLGYLYTDIEEGKTCKLPWCGGKLQYRNDDSQELVKARIASMNKYLPTICMKAAKKNILHVVDGLQTPLDIYLEAKHKINILN